VPHERPPVRAALLYHDPLLWDIIRRVFADAEDVQLVAQLPAMAWPLEALLAARPDVVIVDRRELETTRPAATERLLIALTEHQPSIRVIGLSLADARVTVFSGWQLANISVAELVDWVRIGTSPQRPGRPRRTPERERAHG
jgi:DNA-binding NarL/FixJ family response regulator